jgi:DNA-binding NarL/FixJ family response regulator
MPFMDGYATLKMITEEWPTIKSIILTQHQSDFHVLRMYQAGAKGYVMKDCETSELINAVKKVYSGDLYFAEGGPTKNSSHKLPVLSEREFEFLRHCQSDLKYKEIAARMFVSIKTIEYYQSSLFKKFNVTSRLGLVMSAMESGLL